MKHTVRSHRMLALLLTLVMVISMLPVSVLAAEHTIVGSPEQVQLGADAAAQRVNNFNMGWKFLLGESSGASNQNFDDSAWTNVNLPHDFSITQHFTSSGEAESGFLPGGTGWYRKSFVIGEEAAGKTFLLNFDGAYKDTYVYVNGTFVGEHHYGYSNFAFDISEKLICDGATQNVVAVKVVNQLPSSRWYSGSGIYRDVTLYALDPVHVDLNGVQITTPNIANGDGTAVIKVDLINDSADAANVTVKTTIDGVSGQTTVSVPAYDTAEAELEVAVTNPELWSIEDPNLYTAEIEVLMNGDVVDFCEETFGYRWFSWSEQGFALNGENVKLNGVCLHHDQGALGAAAYYDAMYRQLSIMKDMGCNAIRTSHNPADEQFIQICSELGLLVIEEHFDGITQVKNGNSNDFARYFKAKVDTNLYGTESGMLCSEYVVRSIVKRDRNEPSVFAWSYGNEIQEGNYVNDPDYATYSLKYIDWLNEEDGTRIATIGDNSKASGYSYVNQVLQNILDAGGVVGFNYHCHQANSQNLVNNWGGQWGCILASETSSHVNSRGFYKNQASASTAYGYHLTSYDTSAVGWGDTANDSMWDTLTKDYIAGEFVWTGFDYIGEPTPWNGTGTGDGGRGAIPNSSYFGIVETTGFPKDNYYLYRAQWNQDETTVHLVTAWDSDNMMTTSGKTPVWVYTNAAKVELYLNDDLIGTTTGNVNTTAAGHEYYTYTPVSNNTSVCTAQTGYNSESLYSIFNVAYTAGTLKAVAYDANGVELDTYTISTPGAVTKLVASADKTTINANNSDLVYVEVDVTDANGNLKTTATNNITFTVEGPAEIAGVDNGDQATVRKYQNSYVLTDRQHANIDAYAGKALVILRATDEGGEIKLTIGSNGLEGQTITVTSEGGKTDEQTGLVSYEMIRDYTVKAGTAPALNTAITGNLADGSTITGTITWRTVSEDLYNEPGDHTISGVADFPGYEEVRVSARLHVIPNVVALRNVATATMAGFAPVLPDTVSGVLANGELSGVFEVEWNEVAASEFDAVGKTVVVSGTAVIFGEETLPVTCIVRVAEAVNTESTNVATGATLNQDIPAASQSDNLNSINDGNRNPGEDTNGRWTNWNNRYNNANSTITLVWATAVLLSDVNMFYRYDRDCAKPESVVFSYSLDGSEFVEIGYTETAITDVSIGNGAGFTYALDEVINPIAMKITFTQQGGTSGGKCVGLYEVETMTYAASLEKQTGAQLSAIKVGGTDIEGFDPAVYSYEIGAGEVTAEAAENVGITILPSYKGYVRILTVSEDGASANVYTLAVDGEVCYHENTETVPGFAATCTREGKSDGKRCTVCGEMTVPQEVIPALGHTEVTIPGTPATFDEPGTSDGIMCSVCDTILAQQEPTPVLDYNEGIIPIDVLTATAGDSQPGEGPERVLDNDFGTLWHTDWYGTSRAGHWIQFELSEEYVVDGLRYKPRQTGGNNGIITAYDIQVSNDGENFTSVASGNWAIDGKWKIVEFEGQSAKYVRLVAVQGVTDQSYVFSSAAEIRLTGEQTDHVHNFVDWTVTTDPTCTDAGVETGTCSCGRTQTREIPALGHNPAEAVRENEKPATCFAAGSYESVVYCDRCDAEISRETVTIPALNHANTIVRDAMEPTCTEEGYTGDTWCLDCGRRLSVGEVIPVTDHVWENGSCVHCGAQNGNVGTGTFVDVPEDAWFAPAVEWAVENGITAGVSETMFGPAQVCVRAQAVTFLWRAAGEPEPTSNENPFVDVTADQYYYQAVLWAVEKGITAGVDDTHFDPNGVCTRGQIVTFLYRAVGKPDVESTENPFEDVAEGLYYYNPILWAAETGVTAGVDATHFAPDAQCNRAEIVTFLYRAYN